MGICQQSLFKAYALGPRGLGTVSDLIGEQNGVDPTDARVSLVRVALNAVAQNHEIVLE